MKISFYYLIDKIFNYFLGIFLFTLPVFFLPFNTNFYDFNKNLLLVIGTGILFFFWVLKIAFEKKITFYKTPFLGEVIFFCLAFLTAVFFASPNKFEAMFFPLGGITVISLTILYFIISQNLSRKNLTKTILQTFLISGTTISILTILHFLGINKNLFSWEWIKAENWTPLGEGLSLIAFLLICFPLFLSSFFKHQKIEKTIINSIFLVIVVVALNIAIYQTFLNKQTAIKFLPYRFSWAIAMETFKRMPLLGVGPVNYLSAFSRFRPPEYNLANDLWNVRFGNGPVFLLYLLTIGGVLNLAAFILILIKIIFNLNFKKDYHFSLVIALILLFILPANFILLWLLFIFLAILAGEKTKGEKTFTIPSWIGNISLASSLILAIIVCYWLVKVWTADFYFNKSLIAIKENRGTDAYNFQTKAIRITPKRVDFRIAFSQLNFILAQNLAQKPEPSEQDNTTIVQLISQAINEAKVAVSLNPVNITAWENLSTVYRNLLNSAQGADQWAITAYQQAILVDPINPLLRLDLGGIFYSLQNYDAAIRHFQDVVNLKPDYANGFYNLAAAYREEKKYLQAYQAMQAVLNLLSPDSEDWKKAKSELDELAKQLPSPSPQSSVKEEAQKPTGETQLQTPQPLPSPLITNPITLPKEASPSFENLNQKQ